MADSVSRLSLKWSVLHFISPLEFPPQIQMKIRTANVLKVTKKQSLAEVSFTKSRVWEDLRFQRTDVQTIEDFYAEIIKKCPTIPAPFLLWIESDFVDTLIASTAHAQRAIKLQLDRHEPVSFIAGKVNATVINRLVNPTNPILCDEMRHLLDQSTQAHAERAPVSPMRAVARHEEARAHLRTEITEEIGNQEFHTPIRSSSPPDGRTNTYQYTTPTNLGIVPVPVWAEHAPLLLSLSSLLYTIQTHLVPRGRCDPVDEAMVMEICKKMKKHIIGRPSIISSDDDEIAPDLYRDEDLQ
jgi:hypothetical protein